MMRVSTKVRYGLRVLVSLARLGGCSRFVSTRRLAAEEDVSAKYLERILGLLRRAGIIEAHEGRTGGVRLRRPPEEVTVADIMRAVEGDWAVVECLKKGCPKQNICPTRSVWRRLNDATWRMLTQTRLSELISGGAT